MEQEVLEYFEAYFGGQLNESTTDEDIIDAVYDLIDLTEAVLEAVGLEASAPRKEKRVKRTFSHVKPSPPRGHVKPSPPRGYDPIADYKADRDKHMNTKFRSQAALDASWANRKNWGGR